MAIGIPGAALVGSALAHGANTIRIEADIENGIHHSGHGLGGAGTDGNEKGIISFAESPAGQAFQARQVCSDFFFQARRPNLLRPGKEVAALGRNGEAGRNIELGPGHLRQAGALASHQMLEFIGPVGLTGAKEIDETLGRIHWSCLAMKSLRR